MRWLTAVVLAAWTTAVGANDDLLDAIASRIAQPRVLRAEFTQSRQMAGLKRPLVTSGRLVFARRRGVLWQIELPYRIGYVLGGDRMIEIGPDGTQRERPEREQAGLSQIGDIFRAVFGGDPSLLREHFAVAVRGTPDRWEIDLTPKDAQVGRFLRSVALAGGTFVGSIRIAEANGDGAEIRFRRQQAAEVPSADELAAFQPSGR